MHISDWNKDNDGGKYNICFDISDSAFVLCGMSISDLMDMREKIDQILLEIEDQ